MAVILTIGRDKTELRHMRTADIAAEIVEGLLIIAKRYGYETPAMARGDEAKLRLDAFTRFNRSLDHYPEGNSSCLKHCFL